MSSVSKGDLNWQLHEEETFHDQMAEHDTRGGYFYEWGLSAEAIEFAHRLLGDVRGKRVLDYGCGAGRESVWLAQSGAYVVAIDISQRMVESTLKKAATEGVGDRVTAIKMYGESLRFDNETFDLVFGVSVIHHVNIDLAGPEIARVLKPGGKAVFVEPLNYNPIINFFRKMTPQRRTKTETPLTYRDIERLARSFRDFKTYEFNLVNIIAVTFPWKPLFSATLKLSTQVDHFLLSRFPALRKYCWITVVELFK